MGNFSVGFFHKTIRDFIVSGINTGTIGTGTDNGYAGEYGGFTRLSSANAGTAFVQGWELSYQQQFTSLPGWLKGLGLTANLTALEAHGDYGGRGRRDTRDVEGFVPRIGNVSVFWRHRGITSRVIVNYTGESITEFTDGSPARSRFLAPRTVVNLSFGYQWRPAVSFSIDANNLTNAPNPPIAVTLTGCSSNSSAAPRSPPASTDASRNGAAVSHPPSPKTTAPFYP